MAEPNRAGTFVWSAGDIEVDTTTTTKPARDGNQDASDREDSGKADDAE
jgi:hypothetical protein